MKVSAWVRILMLAARLRHLDGIVEQIVAARGVEPDLLEAIEKIGQPVEQPALPCRPTSLFCALSRRFL